MFWKKAKDVSRFPDISEFLQPFSPSPVESLRPCEVDHRVCRFHRFVDEERALLEVTSFIRAENIQNLRKGFEETGIVPSGCKLTILRETRALIEWPDGSLSTVSVERVSFLDRGDDSMG